MKWSVWKEILLLMLTHQKYQDIKKELKTTENSIKQKLLRMKFKKKFIPQKPREDIKLTQHIRYCKYRKKIMSPQECAECFDVFPNLQKHYGHQSCINENMPSLINPDI